MRDQQIHTIKGRLRDIESVTDGAQSGDRLRLATVYEITLNPFSYMPAPGLEMNKNNAATLRKKVCRFCPSKIKPAAMQKHVEFCKGHLRRYAAKLRQWLSDHNALTEPTQAPSIHDLGSTI